jgi:hypothetical protein
MDFEPLALAILEARTALKVFAGEITASRSCAEIATGKAGELLGAVDISGGTSDDDAAATVAGIEAAGLKVDPELDGQCQNSPRSRRCALVWKPYSVAIGSSASINAAATCAFPCRSALLSA